VQPTRQARLFLSVVFQRFALVGFVGHSVGLPGG